MKNLESLPEHIRPGMLRYLEQGIEPGGFLMRVLCNDLNGARAHADPINKAALPEIFSWVYDYAPKEAWGSEKRVRAWLNAFRQLGRD